MIKAEATERLTCFGVVEVEELEELPSFGNRLLVDIASYE